MRPRTVLALSALFLLIVIVGGPSTSVLAQEPVTETETLNGYVDNPDENSAGSVAQLQFDLTGLEILAVEATVTWSDDEGSSSNPDTLSLSIDDDLGTSDSDSSAGGSLSAQLDQEGLGSNWTVTITCVEAGMTPLGPLGRIGTVDPGNSFSVSFSYTYVPIEVEPPEPPGPPPNIAALYEDPIFWAHVIFMIASTYMFGIVGILAGIALFFRSRWADDPNRWKRALTTNKPFRVVAVHVWWVFFIAAIPLGIYVAGKAYGWENSWSSFPMVWHEWFWQWQNADHVSLIVLALWALPLWLNRKEVMASGAHGWFFGRIGWFRRLAANAPEPKLTTRELAIIYFLMGVFTFLVFVVQSHGN
ncbi:MAG: hypothetical protein JSW25_03460 [Thermoplasmata archaeon]|nr:MAG: hypothetical protein JSW25_03460 [Thermoplasmata archaeon]